MLESKGLLLALLVLYIAACTPQTDQSSQNEEVAPPLVERKHQQGFQDVLDSAAIQGAILIYDSAAKCYFSNDFEWAEQPKTPASTFKIINSTIALDLGVVESDSTILPWDGQARRMRIWEADLSLKEAFQRSCLPCYQEIAREIGSERMRQALDRLQFPGMTVTDSTIDRFWITGESAISPFEWVGFLQRLDRSELDIRQRTEKMVKTIMILDSNQQYVLRAKSGWGFMDDVDIGWLVGYVTTADNVYYFATNVSPTDSFQIDDFGRIRYQVSYAALRQLGIPILD